jgi:small subunit ribosomal protein S20
VANHKQAVKRHRQSEAARVRNVHYRTVVKNVVKKAYAAADKGVEVLTEAFRKAESMLQHVASKGVIPKKRAARKTSRMAKALNQNA